VLTFPGSPEKSQSRSLSFGDSVLSILIIPLPRKKNQLSQQDPKECDTYFSRGSQQHFEYVAKNLITNVHYILLCCGEVANGSLETNSSNAYRPCRFLNRPSINERRLVAFNFLELFHEGPRIGYISKVFGIIRHAKLQSCNLRIEGCVAC